MENKNIRVLYLLSSITLISSFLVDIKFLQPIGFLLFVGAMAWHYKINKWNSLK